MIHDGNRKHGEEVREADDDGLPQVREDHLPQAPQGVQFVRFRQVSEAAQLCVAEGIDMFLIC
jgi:hypothetical protein